MPGHQKLGCEAVLAAGWWSGETRSSHERGMVCPGRLGSQLGRQLRAAWGCCAACLMAQGFHLATLVPYTVNKPAHILTCRLNWEVTPSVGSCLLAGPAAAASDAAAAPRSSSTSRSGAHSATCSATGVRGDPPRERERQQRWAAAAGARTSWTPPPMRPQRRCSLV